MFINENDNNNNINLWKRDLPRPPEQMGRENALLAAGNKYLEMNVLKGNFSKAHEPDYYYPN